MKGQCEIVDSVLETANTAVRNGFKPATLMTALPT